MTRRVYDICGRSPSDEVGQNQTVRRTASANLAGGMPSVMDAKWEPMNELQQLIEDYLSDNPGESYASIGRRGGLPRQTVQHLAKKAEAKQTPHPETLRRLAKGMGLPESYVRAAAADAAGYKNGGDDEGFDQRGRLVVEAVRGLDPERLEALARRARSLLAEMREEQKDRGDG